MAWCDVVEPRTLRDCRIALGQSQAAFAAMLGASPESYRTWDAGRRATPLKMLARARALETHRDDHALLPLTLLNLDNDVPDHSTISRRKARLGKVASYERRTVKPVHLLIDSSGLSVHVGQLRTPPKARDYRKLHLAVDEQTSDVVACELTSKRARDASRVASLVGQIERPIASAKADAAYDTGDVYKTLENHRAHRSPTVLIPPRKGAQLALDSAGTRQRNRNIRARSRIGKRKWYVASGYSRRSKVETTFHRYKAILGSAMRARGLASQRVEVRLGCKILNTMTALGIPDGEMIG